MLAKLDLEIAYRWFASRMTKSWKSTDKYLWLQYIQWMEWLGSLPNKNLGTWDSVLRHHHLQKYVARRRIRSIESCSSGHFGISAVWECWAKTKAGASQTEHFEMYCWTRAESMDISKCSVCDAPAFVFAQHSQTADIPKCPELQDSMDRILLLATYFWRWWWRRTESHVPRFLFGRLPSHSIHWMYWSQRYLSVLFQLFVILDANHR
jgi:hypothetical protein